MTPREIDNRLNVLESRVPAEEQSSIFVKLISSLTTPTDGWSYNGFIHWRKINETDDELFSRIKKTINPQPGELVKLHQVQREEYQQP
jgi:hypothetical protein